MQNSSIRSWNCPCVSPHTVTGARTNATFGSCARISFTRSHTSFTSRSYSVAQVFTCEMYLSIFIILIITPAPETKDIYRRVSGQHRNISSVASTCSRQR
jgi:hypothetical protein